MKVGHVTLLSLSAFLLVRAAAAQSAKTPPGDWPMFNRDLAGTRYSPLTQINTTNVTKLERVWSFRFRTDEERKILRANLGAFSEVTPIVIGGVMYISAGRRVIALEPETGKELWTYTSKFPVSKRGVAYWPGDKENPARLLATTGSKMVALSPKTGSLVPGFGDEGTIEMTVPYDSPPTIYKGLAIVGANNGEDPHGPPGDTRAYDVRTGKKAWEFHTVPQPGEPGHETWKDDGWKDRAGVNNWGFTMTVDTERGIVYMSLGGPSANYWGGDRKGNNLYGNSTVALDAMTGKLKWYFQEIHHDMWDYDMPPAPGLIDIKQNGKTVPALAQVGKMGYMFILDRVTGKPVFGMKETPVPESEVPGEEASPTQPIPVKPPEMSSHHFTMADVVTAEDTTPEHAKACQDVIERSGGVYNNGPYTTYPYRAPGTPPKSAVLYPGNNGSSSWGGTATDPKLGYIIANTQEPGSIGWIEKVAGGTTPYDKNSIFGGGPPPRFEAVILDKRGLVDRDKTWSCRKPPWGNLTAVNASTGEFAWRVTLGVTDELPEGKKNTGRYNAGGPIVTAGGLIFIGATNDHRFRAFDSKTGKELWVTRLDYSAGSVPMTYLGKDGKQYVAVAEGGGIAVGGGDDNNNESLVVFRLP
jgi:glucose dehydrogenase